MTQVREFLRGWFHSRTLILKPFILQVHLPPPSPAAPHLPAPRALTFCGCLDEPCTRSGNHQCAAGLDSLLRHRWPRAAQPRGPPHPLRDLLPAPLRRDLRAPLLAGRLPPPAAAYPPLPGAQAFNYMVLANRHDLRLSLRTVRRPAPPSPPGCCELLLLPCACSRSLPHAGGGSCALAHPPRCCWAHAGPALPVLPHALPPLPPLRADVVRSGGGVGASQGPADPSVAAAAGTWCTTARGRASRSRSASGRSLCRTCPQYRVWPTRTG